MECIHVAGRKFVITAYAARRLARRDISIAELRAVLGAPTSLARSARDPHRLVCRRTVDGRPLAVVIEEIPGIEQWDVVTAWEQEHHD